MTRIRLTLAVVIAMVLGFALLALSRGASSGTAGTHPAARSSAKPAASASAAALAKQIELGRRLALTSGCNDCHTPGTMFGAPDFDRALSGSELGWQGPWGTTYARNLTPDLETGLGYYSDKEIITAMRGGHRLDGSPMLPPMPWQNCVGLEDSDLAAIVAYLKSLPAVSHRVPDRVPPGQGAKGSVLVFPAPPAWDVPPAPAAGTDSTK